MDNQQFKIEPGNAGFAIAQRDGFDIAGVLDKLIGPSRGVTYEIDGFGGCDIRFRPTCKPSFAFRTFPWRGGKSVKGFPVKILLFYRASVHRGDRRQGDQSDHSEEVGEEFE